MKKSIYEILTNAIDKESIIMVRKKIYGDNRHCEIEAMRLFIDSRQEWCKERLLTSLYKPN